MEYHIEKKADITIVTKAMENDEDCTRFGVVQTDEDGRLSAVIVGLNTYRPPCFLPKSHHLDELRCSFKEEEVPNIKFPKIYTDGLVTIGEDSVVPNNVKIGKNTAISGGTTLDDYPSGTLKSGESIIKAGDLK